MKLDQRWHVQIFSIVFMFFAFWPVAVYFIKVRNESAKNGMIFEGLNQKQCTVYSIIFAIASLTLLTDKTTKPFFIVYATGALAIYYYGLKNDKHIERCKKYLDMINVNNITDLNAIAVECNAPYEVCRNEISNLISKKAFGDASINDTQRIIIIRNTNKTDISNTVTVYCNCCNARLTIVKGQNYECDYCGNIIQV